jgi:hypothetical protein
MNVCIYIYSYICIYIYICEFIVQLSHTAALKKAEATVTGVDTVSEDLEGGGEGQVNSDNMYYICIYMYVCMYVCIDIYIHMIYICIKNICKEYIYIYICIYIHIYRL